MIERKPRAVRIEPIALKQLRKAVKSHLTLVDAQNEIGVDRRILKHLLTNDTCSPEKANTIYEYLKQTA